MAPTWMDPTIVMAVGSVVFNIDGALMSAFPRDAASQASWVPTDLFLGNSLEVLDKK